MSLSTEKKRKSIFKIGENINKWRKYQQIKEDVFAEMLHINIKTLRKVENNKIKIGLLEIRIIAAQLQISFKDLLREPATL